ncbi:mCG127709 [Mus musculus]|nr:mCG127709 [Mus musculus]
MLRGFCSSTGCQMFEKINDYPGVSWVLFLLPANVVYDLTLQQLGSSSLGSKQRTPQCLECGHLHTWLPLSAESCGGFTGRAVMEMSSLASQAQDQQQSHSWLRCLEVTFPLNCTARI